jgi:hypothetical protein
MKPTIQHIYERYRTPPQLQLHQRRVAAVALTIVDNLTQPAIISRKDIVSACLLHDMGNIIKFDLTRFPEFLEPEGFKYWQRVQKDYCKEYGTDEHAASLAIARELDMSDSVLELIDSIGFDKTAANLASKNLANMICEYADDRVAPWGIVTLETRIQDFHDRYSSKYPGLKQQKKRQQFGELARKIEMELFNQLTLQPEEITELRLNDTIDGLRDWVL